MGIWLCGVCFKTHRLGDKCRHGADIVMPPDIGDGVVRFVIYDLTKPLAPSCSQLDHVDGLLLDQHDGFTLSLLDSLLLKGLRTVKSIPLKCQLGFSRVLKGALDKVICKPDDVSCWYAAVRVLSSSSVAPNNDATLQELKAKHPFTSAPSLPDIPRSLSPHCITRCGSGQNQEFPLSGAAVAISDELVSFITQVVNLFLEGKCPMILGEYIASTPLTPLVKPGGGIRPIVVGTIWRRLVSKVSATMIGHSLDGYLDGLQFGVWVQ
ncbi:hypothetical protein Tco_1454185 [Tanacetum coccineum]